MRYALLLSLLIASTAWSQEDDKVRPPAVGEAITYKKVGDRELKLFVSKPTDWKATDTRPAIVLFHGGGWNRGAPGMLNPQAEYFAGRGMVAILVEYRLSGGKTEPPVLPCQDAGDRTADRQRGNQLARRGALCAPMCAVLPE